MWQAFEVYRWTLLLRKFFGWKTDMIREVSSRIQFLNPHVSSETVDTHK